MILLAQLKKLKAVNLVSSKILECYYFMYYILIKNNRAIRTILDHVYNISTVGSLLKTIQDRQTIYYFSESKVKLHSPLVEL